MLIAAVFLTGCRSDAGTVASSMLERGFVAPPDSVKISTYWYWISGNVSKEGVAEDLRSMKAAGIDRAYIGNIGDDVPYGPVELMSEPWWEILHTALKTATELDMEIGIFNSPGWSQSGGPWVKPEESMRYLCSSQVRVEGPSKLSGRLPKPEGMIQDVRVIAYPVPKNDGVLLNGGFARYRTVGRRGYAYVRPAPRRENRDRFRVAGAFYRPQHHRTSGTPPDRSECRPRGFGR